MSQNPPVIMRAAGISDSNDRNTAEAREPV